MKPIDVHAHYVPPSLIENVASRASDFGLSVIEHRPTCSCALNFDYGLKVRPFFPKLIEPMEMRLDAMSSQGVDHQVTASGERQPGLAGLIDIGNLGSGAPLEALALAWVEC